MFHSEQAPWHRLDDFYLRVRNRVNWIITKLTGNSPLSLPNAVAKPIKSLTQYGLCTQDGTPTPEASVDIMCNNGALKWDSVNQRVYADGTSANLYDPSKRTDNVAIPWSGVPYASTGMCYSAAIPVEQGKTYYYRLILGEKSPSVQAHRFIQIYDNDNEPSADNPAVSNPQFIIIDSNASVGAPVKGTFSTNNQSVKFVRLSLCMSDSFVMFSEYDAVYYPYHNGELVIVESYGENLVNVDTNIAGYYINSSGKITAGADAQYTDLIPVTPGEKYVWTLMSNRQVGGTNRWHGYDSSGNWVGQIAYKFSGQGTDIPFELSAIIPSGISYVRLSYGIADVDVSFRNSQYQFTTVPMLLSVGDVKDEVELIHGTLTRRVTACLYDGTQPVGDVYMSTTGGKDAGAIIIYPLATPTTEQITGQNLVTNEGTNVVDSVANVSPIQLEVEYAAKRV